jgi:hypothetical protein
MSMMDQDICTIFGERQGDVPADAPGASGDQDNFIQQGQWIRHHHDNNGLPAMMQVLVGY